MAATIAKARGASKSKESTWATRLGSENAQAQANTWKTFTECVVWADGHGHVEVRRNDQIVLRLGWNAEGEDMEFTGFVGDQRIEPPLVLGSTRRRRNIAR